VTVGVVLHRPGDPTPRPMPGDLILCHGDRFIHKFVQIGQRTRMFLGRVGTFDKRGKWTHYDHVAVYAGVRVLPGWPAGTPAVIEALPGGVRVTPLRCFDRREYLVVDVNRCVARSCPARDGSDAETADRRQAVAYVEACIGLEYGLVFHYLGMTLTTLTAGGLTFSGSQQEICSSMAAQSAVRIGHIFDRPPPATMPADLMRHFVLA
jgi:hypothetical protein